MKKKINLKPCIFCGAPAEMKTQKSHFAKTSGGIDSGQKFFIRCSKCHARTAAFMDDENAKLSWTVDNVFQVK